MDSMEKEVIRADRLYQYTSGDGITRMRCGRHLHHEPWGRPMRLWAVWPLGRRTCLECAYEMADVRAHEMTLLRTDILETEIDK